MAILTIKVLKQILQSMPDDYKVEFNNKSTTVPVTDRVEIDITEKKIIFK